MQTGLMLWDMAKSRRVLVLVHPQFRPDRVGRRSATEFDVWTALRSGGHAVEIAAARHDLRRFDRELSEFKPDIVFNLLEEFRGEGVFDFHLVSYLEALGIPYTGCNPRGLVVTRNKLWTAHIAQGQGLAAPNSALARGSARRFSYPAFVKFNREHASLGITQQNLVRDARQLQRSLSRLESRHGGEIVVQSFVAGEEVSVSVWGNRRLEVFAPWRLGLRDENAVATARVKFNAQFRRRQGIRATRFRGPQISLLQSTAKTLFASMDLSGYARFDFRLNAEGTPFLIDVNANPNLAKDEDFAASARVQGHSYADVIERVLQLGLDYEPRV
jgi:D-alanine-D-alanine ligase